MKLPRQLSERNGTDLVRLAYKLCLFLWDFWLPYAYVCVYLCVQQYRCQSIVEGDKRIFAAQWKLKINIDRA